MVHREEPEFCYTPKHGPDPSENLLKHVQLSTKNPGELHDSLKSSLCLLTAAETPQLPADSCWAEWLGDAAGHQTARSQCHQLRSAWEQAGLHLGESVKQVVARLAQVPGKGAGSRRQRPHIAMATYVTAHAAKPFRKHCSRKLDRILPRPACLHSHALLSICLSLFYPSLNKNAGGRALIFCSHMLGPLNNTHLEVMAQRLKGSLAWLSGFQCFRLPQIRYA